MQPSEFIACLLRTIKNKLGVSGTTINNKRWSSKLYFQEMDKCGENSTSKQRTSWTCLMEPIEVIGNLKQPILLQFSNVNKI